MMSALVLLVSVASAQAPTGEAQPAKSEAVLVAGDPPLTAEMVGALSGFLEWLLDVPLTAEQRKQIETGMVTSWQTNNREEIDNALELLGLDAQVGQLDKDQRALAREQAQPAVLEQLRNSPDDEAAQWILAIYESGHQPLAEGNPPLTRQVTDACAEYLCFTVGEVIGQQFEVPAEFKDGVAKYYASDYADMSPEQQQELSAMPMQWAALRVAWPRLPDEERAKYRDQWAEAYKNMIPEQPAAEQPAADQTTPEQGGESTAATTSGSSVEEMLASSRRAAMLSNMLQMQHETTMSIIGNIGGYTYQYRY